MESRTKDILRITGMLEEAQARQPLTGYAGSWSNRQSTPVNAVHLCLLAGGGLRVPHIVDWFSPRRRAPVFARDQLPPFEIVPRDWVSDAQAVLLPAVTLDELLATAGRTLRERASEQGAIQTPEKFIHELGAPLDNLRLSVVTDLDELAANQVAPSGRLIPSTSTLCVFYEKGARKPVEALAADSGFDRVVLIGANPASLHDPCEAAQAGSGGAGSSFENIDTDRTSLIESFGPDPERAAQSEALVRSESELAFCELLREILANKIESTSIQKLVLHERDRETTSRQSQDLREKIDHVKRSLAQSVQELTAAISEDCRRTLLGNGAMRKAIRDYVSALAVDDLVRVVEHRNIRLSLSDSYRSALNGFLEKLVRQDIKKHVAEINTRSSEILADLRGIIKDQEFRLPSADDIAVDERQMRRAIIGLSSVEVKYRGEMPRQTAFQRLMEGRRILFPITMLVSLIGTIIGRNLRYMQAFAVLLFVLFVGGYIYTFFSWRKQEEERLSKELLRARDQIESESARLLSDLLREESAELGKAIEGIKRTITGATEGYSREQAIFASGANETQRTIARGNLRILDERLKLLTATMQELDCIRDGILDEHPAAPNPC